MHQTGEYTISDLGELFSVSRPTAYCTIGPNNPTDSQSSPTERRLRPGPPTGHLGSMGGRRVFFPSTSRHLCGPVGGRLLPDPRMAVYPASKWAVIGWSDSVRLELKQAGLDHVKVTTVCPYYVRTGMFDGARSAPLLPLLDPVEVFEEPWTAMLAGRPFVVPPKTVILSEILTGVVPTGVRDFIADHVIGVHYTMDDFTGRTEASE